MLEHLYLHLDSTCNAVLAKGLTSYDFNSSVSSKPANLLLLSPGESEGTYDRHTGLMTVQGDDVAAYLTLLQRQKNPVIKWIDFSDLTLLRQLTQIEISELLYFGHMKTHLHAPFFYKLQNNFVYFEWHGGMTKIYYRHMNEFYQILADKIRRTLLEKLNGSKSFFRRSVPVDPIPLKTLEEMRTLLQEGVTLSFAQQSLINKEYRIPVYLTEDHYRDLSSAALISKELVATLIYQSNRHQWILEKDEDFEEWPYKHTAFS